MNRTIRYDIPDYEANIPKTGDYLVSRWKNGHWGTAYLIIKARQVKQRKPNRNWRRYALEVQRQCETTPEILRLAQWWLKWDPRIRRVAKPDLLGAA